MNIYVVRVYISAIIWQTYSHMHVCEKTACVCALSHSHTRANCQSLLEKQKTILVAARKTKNNSRIAANCQSLLEKQKKCLVQVYMHLQTQ